MTHLWEQARDSAADVCKATGVPLTATQATLMSGALAVWMERAAEAERQECIRLEERAGAFELASAMRKRDRL